MNIIMAGIIMSGVGLYLALIFALCIAALFAVPFLNGRNRRRHLRRVALDNENLTPKTHMNSKTFFADGALTRYRLLKQGSDATHATTCGASDRPLGNSEDAPTAAEYPFALYLFGLGNKTAIVIASEEIDAGEEVYTAANGKVSTLSAVAATYYKVGVALTAAGADGEKLEILPCYPVAVVVAP